MAWYTDLTETCRGDEPGFLLTITVEQHFSARRFFADREAAEDARLHAERVLARADERNRITLMLEDLTAILDLQTHLKDDAWSEGFRACAKAVNNAVGHLRSGRVERMPN